MREWHRGATAGGKNVTLGEHFDGKERFQAKLQGGEMLLWPPWLPHSARVLDADTYSINGHTLLLGTGQKAPTREVQRALEAKRLTQPAACQDTEDQESKYLYGDNMDEVQADAEAAAKEAEMMSMEEATRNTDNDASNPYEEL